MGNKKGSKLSRNRNWKDGMAEMVLFMANQLVEHGVVESVFIHVHKPSKSDVRQVSTTNILWNQWKYKHPACKVKPSTS